MTSIILLLACTLCGVIRAEAAPATADKPLTWSFRCTPDEKSKAAGAEKFVDTLEVADGTVKSTALAEEGFPAVKAEPKTVNDVVTLNATFKKTGATAAYFVRVKPDGTFSGSLTRREGEKMLRYTIGATSEREAAEGKAPAATSPKSKSPKATPDAALDPAVLRVNGGFVSLMSAQAALADAGINSDKAKLAAILKTAGADQNKLRAALLKGEMTPDEYATQAGAKLDEGKKALAAFLGTEKSAAVATAYRQPFTATFVYLNQMRAAVAESGGNAAGVKQADQAVRDALVNLTTMARAPGKLTPESAEELKKSTRADVIAALGPRHSERFEKTLDGFAAYEPE